MTNNKILTLLFTCFLFTTISYSQNKELENASNDFATIEQQNRFVETLNIGSGERTAHNLPVGIKKIVGNIEFTLAITKVRFDQQIGRMTLLMKMVVPNKNKVLIFGANDIRISYAGDLVGDVQLFLLSDVPISMGNAGDFLIKGSYDEKTGAINSKTYVTLDCNGEFVELSIDGEVVLNKNTFKAVKNHVSSGSAIQAGDSTVRASVKTIVKDWNDIFAEITLPPFEIKGVKDVTFSITSATLDFSDYRSPQNFNPGSDYMNKYFPVGDIDLWRGIYINEFQVTLPPHFKKKDSTERITIAAERMLIDENGITGLVKAKNVLPFEQGDASGWSFSVTDFQLELIANNISGFGFGGQVGIPISKEQQVLDYEAFISQNEYLVRASVKDSMKIDMFGDANLRLEKTSYLEMKVKNEKFIPRIVLDGQMNLNIDGLSGDTITFSRLAISADAPIISVDAMGYGGEISLNNFPLTISDIQFVTRDQEISLAFDAKINLMQDKLSAGTRLTLLTEYKDKGFNFKGLNIGAIILDGAKMSGFTLDGELRMEKDHPIYGKYFGGDIKATFGALSDDLTVGVTAVFGRKDFRYWYVEGNATFAKAGVPVGPFTINGFTGGVYYKMSPTGGKGLQAYQPNENTSLGLKAGISYYIAKDNTINGNALFETNFSSSGGINTMKFYGTARFMTSLDLSKVGGDKLENMYKKSQERLSSLSDSFASKEIKGLNSSELAKNILPDIPEFKPDGGLSAYLSINYDFPTKTFDADFRIMVNVPGGFLRGTGSNNEAGWVKLHLSPQDWYVHAGTPTNPIGLQLGLGPLSLSTKSYIMFGDKLENPAAPPKQVLDILKITPEQADYMKYPAIMEAGKGVAFGTNFSFDTGNISFLILYARFMAGAGFDIMLRDMSNYACEGSNSSVGHNGWYANGQCYAYLQGELGVRIKLLFINKRITIIKGSTAALLQARFPNPTWIGGQLAVRVNVLGGLINANMKMKMSFGDDCKLVQIGGDYSPIDLPIISDLSPLNKDTDVDVFLSPQATLNMKAGEPFNVEDESGNVKIYRINLEDFYVMDNNNKKIDGHIIWNKEYDVVTFEPKEVMPPNSDMKAYISMTFEELNLNNKWEQVIYNGKPARESRTAEFKTGDAPQYIPLSNIQYCYPVVSQKNFYVQESSQAYIQLKKGQSYLFPDNFKYNAVIGDSKGNESTVSYLYDKSNSRITYLLPYLSQKTSYHLELTASSNISIAENKETITKSESTLQDDEGESYTINYAQQRAQEVIKDGSLSILKYTFATSNYNTLKEKIASLNLVPNYRYVSTDVRSLILSSAQNYELFDESELFGNDYTENRPLVHMEALLEDEYYIKDIAPLIYDWYPMGIIRITYRDPDILGVPPVRGFSVYDGYMSFLQKGIYDSDYSNIIPFVYDLPSFYAKDYYTLRSEAAGMFEKNLEPLIRLSKSRFPFIRKGVYKAKIKYVLPGINQVKSYGEVKYLYE